MKFEMYDRQTNMCGVITVAQGERYALCSLESCFKNNTKEIHFKFPKLKVSTRATQDNLIILFNNPYKLIKSGTEL